MNLLKFEKEKLEYLGNEQELFQFRLVSKQWRLAVCRERLPVLRNYLSYLQYILQKLVWGSSNISLPEVSYINLIVDCGDKLSVANGQVEFKGKNTFVSHKVPVKCNEGYKIQGDKEITCLPTGSWSTGTSCVIKGTVLRVKVFI